MAYRDRAAFTALYGTNSYVPGMQFAHGVSNSHPTPFSLGTPAAKSANNIATAIVANAVATTQENYSYTADSTYGRSLRMTPSGNPGNAFAIDVFGFDYLGQPMVERFTGANGSTAIIYGKKAFKRVTHTKIVTAASNAITAALGTGDMLGLPFKGDVAWAQESGIQVPLFKRDTWFFADRAAAQAVSGGSKWVRPPFPGFVKTLSGTPDGGGGATDPVITVELGGTAIVGLTVTIDTSDVAGLTATDTPTTPGYNANNRFIANGLIEIVGAAAAGAFGDRVGLELTPVQVVLPDLTDPATTVTGDPRGTYEGISVPNGSIEFVVGLIGESAVNTSNNGGLHGIRHAAS